jgi:hypothetical protein
MTLDRYTYARDNPERYEDPDGHRYAYTTGQATNTESVCQVYAAACRVVPSGLWCTENGNCYTPATQAVMKSSSTSSPTQSVTTTTIPERTCTEGEVRDCTQASVQQLSIEWNWNAAGSIAILIGSVMLTAAIPIWAAAGSLPTVGRFGANSQEGGLLLADLHIFEYLNGNPNPSAEETAEIWLEYMTYGAIK